MPWKQPRETTLALLLIVALSGCGGGQPQAPPEGEAPTAEAPAPAPGDPGVPLQALVDAALHGQTGAVLGRLHDPVRMTREPLPNRHNPVQTDTVRTLYYDGLHLVVYHVTASDAAFITDLVVSGRQYETAEGLHVGAGRADVESALGPPDERRNGAYIYPLTEEVPNQLHVAFDGDAVSRMAWTFYLD